MKKRTHFYPIQMVERRSLFCLTAILFLVFAANLFAQPDTLWTRTYENGAVLESSIHLLPTVDGGTFIVGTIQHSPDIAIRGFVRRVDAAGSLLWYREYGTEDATVRFDMAIMGPESTIVVSTNTQNLVAFSMNGDTLWTGESLTTGYSIMNFISLPDGGYLAAGSAVEDINYTRPALMWFDETGNFLMYRSYPTQEVHGEGYASWVVLAADGSLGVLIGPQITFSNMLVKMTSTGDTLWTKSFDWPGVEGFRCIANAPAGGFYLGGTAGVLSDSLLLIRTDESGDTLWTNRPDYLDQSAYLDVFALKTAPDSTILVASTYRTAESNYIRDIALLMSVDRLGHEQWTYSMPGVEEDFVGHDVVFASNGDILFGATHWIYSPDWVTYSWLAKFESVESDASSPYMPTISEFKLGLNYPNPFNSSVSIPLELSKPQLVDIRIYNLLGQEVYSFGSRMMLPGRQELVWDGVTNAGVGLASGAYIVQARTAGEVKSVKVELIR